MLQGFEAITSELTLYERTFFLPPIAGFLSLKKGKGNEVKNRDIINFMNDKGYMLSEIRVRKIINAIRNANLIPGLLANSKGYFISENPEEINLYIQSLEGRCNAVQRIKETMVAYLISLTSKNQA